VASSKLLLKSRRVSLSYGHSFTADIFLAEQTQNLENAFVVSCSGDGGKVTFSRQMAEQMKNYNLDNAVKKI